MVTTADLAAIHAQATRAGAKLLLTGDHKQLAAVGAGGVMDLLTATAPSYELADARRFTQPWEREATLRLRDGDQSVLGDYHRHGRLLDAGTIEQAEASAARAFLADTVAGRHALLIVDSNEQAARISARVRADLVRLGLVEEAGVPLGLHGTWAGVGDLVQARRNGWELAGVDGNRRGPVNREQYRILDTRADGGLIVAPIIGRGPAAAAAGERPVAPGDHVAQHRAHRPAGEQLGEQMTLPGSYVAAHVTLGYASTVHAAEGLTVDTTHSVVTPSTGAEALYVGMSRGRHRNTAHVVTRAVPADAPPGAVADAVHRSPSAVLAGTMETAEPQRSALATATEAAEATRAIRTPAELLADAAELATTGRTARWLDQLLADGHLTAEQRVALAAEDGGTTLSRVLRRAELAGHDPHQVLLDAVTSRPLDDARQVTNVLHHRITESVSLDPVGETYADWIPRVDDLEWRAYLTQLADTADARRHQLGAEIAASPPQWALESLGPVPSAPEDLAGWKEQAGTVAAHRELTGHDDPTTALGVPPKPGQVETYASWRAAWRALGRPEADRDELEMSDGKLHARVRAYEREIAWGPRYVANELAGTRQAADQHRNTATLRTAEAAATEDPTARATLEQEATEAAALADVLDTRSAELEIADETRALWYAHTADTRAAADRARSELSARRAADGREDPLTAAEEWLAAQAEAQRAEDPHRHITDDADLTDTTAEHAAAVQAVEPAPHTDAPETAIPDIRDLAAAEPPQTGEDLIRVPTADETAVAVARAQRALTELAQRQAADERRAIEDARAAQLARWHTDDQHAAHEPDLAAARGLEPTLEPSTPLD